MAYLILFLLVAAAGIALLWVHQRRQRAHLYSVNGFRESLLKISSHRVDVPGTEPEGEPPDSPPRLSSALDPARREAARRRLEARRAIRTH